MPVKLAETEAEIRSCFPVMRQLRPRYREDEFVAQVLRQQGDGYRLAVLTENDRPVAVAGFRCGENLAWGRYLYVDDLVTDGSSRSRGHGRELLEWLRQSAIDAGCDELHLDSGVQRFAAHRFYLGSRMNITSHHFALDLREPGAEGSG